MTTWGVVATIKADTATILRFAAYHLELGAHRIYIYLDTPNPEAQELLRAHPKARVIRCDDGYWKRHNGSRPEMHQPRQTLNATRAYNRAQEVDWLMHMDVDEFLVPSGRISDLLGALPDNRHAPCFGQRARLDSPASWRMASASPNSDFATMVTF